MLHKRAQLNTEHPPGQIVNPIINFEKPLGKLVDEFAMTRFETQAAHALKMAEQHHKNILNEHAALLEGNASKTAQIDVQALEIERLRGRVRRLEKLLLETLEARDLWEAAAKRDRLK